MSNDKRHVFTPFLALMPDSPIPLHYQLSEGLIKELRQRRVPRETYMPSMLALAKKYCLHRDTVRKAYAEMEAGGIIQRNAGGRMHQVTDEFADSCAEPTPMAIGMVLPNRMEDLLYPRIVAAALHVVGGIMDAASDLGFTIMVVPLPLADDELSRLQGWLKSMLSRLNGLVYLGEDDKHRHDQAFALLLAEKTLPQVFISGHRFQEHLGVVTVDMEKGIDQAVAHLQELGHRKIAVVGEQIPVRKIFQLQTYDRVPLMVSSLRRRRISLPAGRLQIGALGRPEENIAWLRQVLSSADRPTAILADNATNTELVLQVAAELALRIPDDLSLIGYGLSEQQASVTTISHPWRESGQAAVGMIAESIRRQLPVKQLDRVLSAPLLQRGSTAVVPDNRR